MGMRWRLKAREFIGKIGPLALPVSIEAYAAAAGATVKVQDLDPGEAGWSFQKPNGDRCICVNRQDRRERQRFGPAALSNVAPRFAVKEMVQTAADCRSLRPKCRESGPRKGRFPPRQIGIYLICKMFRA
jgi:hypothetical protein